MKQTLSLTRQHDANYEPGDGDAAFIAVGEPGVFDGGAVPPSPRVSGGRRPPPDFVVIAFELKDGTASVRGYDLVSSFFTPNIAISGTFREAITALRASVPVPSPTP